MKQTETSSSRVVGRASANEVIDKKKCHVEQY